ncbi:uncharacterized protein LOC128990487 [Macrosteles quadrilineatus]|uniref:uncharacterized protein LOC128990487 n=1 Tax=Macrosteles quadrilineatus TaxID=74068 RepID=UPI0023E31529|nr:uncharacterized protein LOC128990487 [Macrosteles quadrilineatus]
MIRLVLVSSFILILGFYEVKGAPNYLSLKNDETRPPYRSIEGKDLLGLAGGAMIFAGGVVKTAGVVNLGLAPLYFAPPVAAGVCLTYAVVSYGLEKTKEAAGYVTEKAQEAASYVTEKAQEAAVSGVNDEISKKLS